MEWNGLGNFGRGSSKEPSFKIILKVDALVKEEKQFKGFSIFCSGGHLVQRSGTVSAIFVVT